MNKPIRMCAICGSMIPFNKNNNTKYCSEECYDYNKAKVAQKNRQKRSEELVLLRNEEILMELIETFGSGNDVSAKELINRDFNWSIFSSEVPLEGLVFTKIITHGYCLFTDQIVRLWKF